MGQKGFAKHRAPSSPALTGTLSFSACWQRPLATFGNWKKESKGANVRLWEADFCPDHTPSDPSSSRFSPTAGNTHNTRLEHYKLLLCIQA